MAENVIAAIAARQKLIGERIAKGQGGKSASLLSHFAWRVKDSRSGLAIATLNAVRKVDDEHKSITFVVSDNGVDRDGDIVDPLGINNDNYIHSDVWLFSHGDWKIPIGKTISPDGQFCWWADEQKARQTCWFDTHDESAMLIYDKVSRGFLKGASIAFVPLIAYRREEEHKANSRTSPLQIAGWHFTSIDHTETSVVPIAANPRARAELRDSIHADKSFMRPELYQAFKSADNWVSKGVWNGFCCGPDGCKPCEVKAMKTVKGTRSKSFTVLLEDLKFENPPIDANRLAGALRGGGCTVRLVPNGDNPGVEATGDRSKITQILNANGLHGDAGNFEKSKKSAKRSPIDSKLKNRTMNGKKQSTGDNPMVAKTKTAKCKSCKHGKPCAKCKEVKPARKAATQADMEHAAPVIDVTQESNFTDCVAKKIAELVKIEPDLAQDKRIAAAFSICEKGDKAFEPAGTEDIRDGAKALLLSRGKEYVRLVMEGESVLGFTKASADDVKKAAKVLGFTKAMDESSGKAGGYVTGKEEEKDDDEEVSKAQDAVEDEATAPSEATDEGVEIEADSQSDDESIEDGDDPVAVPHGARVLANVNQHVEALKEYLKSELPAMDNPELKSSLQEHLDDHLEKMTDNYGEMFGTHYPDHKMADVIETAPGEGENLDLEGEAGLVDDTAPEEDDVDEFDDTADVDDDGVEVDPEDQVNPTTQEILDRYRESKGVKPKKKDFTDTTNATGNAALRADEKGMKCIKDAGEYMMDLAAHDETPNIHKAGLCYHAQALDGVHKSMSEPAMPTDGMETKSWKDQQASPELVSKLESVANLVFQRTGIKVLDAQRN